MHPGSLRRRGGFDRSGPVVVPSLQMHFGLRQRAVRRAFAGVAARLFACVLATPGVCAMTPPAAAEADAHACCQKGLLPAMPSCCLDAPSTDTLARQERAAPTLAAASAQAAVFAVVPPPADETSGFPGTTPRHPPPRPPSVLRV